LRKLRSIWQNPWTITGALVAVLSVLFFISFQVLGFLIPTRNPYKGLWDYMVLPAFLVVGLLLIPLGWYLETRRRRKYFPEIKQWPRFPRLDFNEAGHRRGLMIFVTGTMVVIPLVGVSSYEGYHYTDSTQFCGQVCHTVMEPEYTAFQRSPHARVTCAACHIGPGASWFVKSKLSGVRQVFAVTLDTFNRPIPTPVKDLRPARETCEQCHWPAKFFGSQLVTRVHYSSDQGNTRSESRMLVKTGGGDSTLGPASGIHWHMALSNRIMYVAADEKRQQIPWVQSTDPVGNALVYRSDGKAGDDPPPGELRQLDCMDCHNRPTHVFLPPDRAVNISLETGRIDRNLPYIKKVTVEALTQDYAGFDEAGQKIGEAIRSFYRDLEPDRFEMHKDGIERAILEAQSIYRTNFFPEMNVNWKTYPDNIGHMFFEGCFRCHDDRHVSSRRTLIRKDCIICHEFQKPVQAPDGAMAFEQGAFEHPVKLAGIHEHLNCDACHTGGREPEKTCDGCHERQHLFRLGKRPLLEGMSETPALMADLDCDSCHDLSQPRTQASIAVQCEACHESGYGDMIQLWKDDVQADRQKAIQALSALSAALAANRPGDQEPVRAQLTRLRAAMETIDRAGPVHNPELAAAIYQRIIKMAAESRNPPSNGER